MKKKIYPEISIIIPAKDEEETIEKVLTEVNSITQKYKNIIWEVIVVADHCIDKTEEIAKKNSAQVIQNEKSAGKGNALSTGFKQAKGDIIIMMDADYSHKAEDIPSLIKPLENEKIGLVIASRCLGGSGEYTFIRSLGNIFLTFILNKLMHLKLTDGLNGFKAFKKDIIKNQKFSSKSFEIEIELIYYTLLKKKNIIEIPSYERARAGGQMKSHAIKHGTRFLWYILNKGLQYNMWKIFNP